MPNNGGWIDLESVILDYINESEQSSHKYFKLYHIAFRGMEQLGIDFFYQIKTVRINVDSTLTAQLPSDYATYSKIGVLNEQGEIIPFTSNSNLSLFKGNSPNRVSRLQEGDYTALYDPSSLCFCNYWNGFGYANLYGAAYGIPTNGYNGNFRIDEYNQVIVLDPSFNYTDIILEYTAFPKEGEKYFIPAVFREALISWLSWKDISSAPAKRAIIEDKAARRHEFYNERRLARARFKPFHLLEAYETNLNSQRLTIKV